MSLSKRPCKKEEFGGESEATLLGVISDELISLRGNVEGMKTFRELLFLYLFCFQLILTSLNSRIACRADRTRELKRNPISTIFPHHKADFRRKSPSIKTKSRSRVKSSPCLVGSFLLFFHGGRKDKFLQMTMTNKQKI